MTDDQPSDPQTDAPLVPTKEQLARRRSRSVALAVALGALVVLFYLVTIVKIGGNIASRPL
ncbi:MAG TPA: hypothetical protein PKA74_06975 [Bauldia sp.]|nr:hypothetical protein [Bauldia sp.]